MVLIMSLELVAVSAATHLTGVVIYVVCLVMVMRKMCDLLSSMHKHETIH